MNECEQPKFILDSEIEQTFWRNRRQRQWMQRVNQMDDQNNQGAPANQLAEEPNSSYLAPQFEDLYGPMRHLISMTSTLVSPTSHSMRTQDLKSKSVMLQMIQNAG